MAEIQMLVSDPTLARQVEQLAGAADLAVTSRTGPEVALVVCDRSGLERLSENAGRFVPAVVLVAGEADETVWHHAAEFGVEQVVVLPGGAPLLDSRLRTLGPAPGAGRLVRVIGVRGGCGTTAVAVGVARALLDRVPVVLVDGDRHGPGLETPLGLADTGGVRWPALADIRGRMPATSLTGRLPERDGLLVLSHTVADSTASDDAWTPVVRSLVGADVTVVADIPRAELDQHPPVGSTRDVLVMPRDVAGIMCARQLLRDGRTSADPLVVVRDSPGPVELGAVRAALDGVPLVPLRTCRGVVGASDFGDLADAVARGPFARVCRAVVAQLDRRADQARSGVGEQAR